MLGLRDGVAGQIAIRNLPIGGKVLISMVRNLPDDEI
jgi:hypothetical protein